MNHSNDPNQYHKIILETLEKVGLIGIAMATVWAVSYDVALIIDHGRVTLADLLLMFIYLEVLAMVSHYFASGQLPIRFPLYIAIVALARYLILDMKSMDDWRIAATAFAILILAFSVLVIRYGHVKYPYNEFSRSRTRRKGDRTPKRTGISEKNIEQTK
ncbi:MAG: phosphate-starvation-inducible PsiE family protein [Gammaproteobacteria bacterium]|nr:phosphate-starvation-inducible PsiE family protein [Gammaproteobacteria bacterium]